MAARWVMTSTAASSSRVGVRPPRDLVQVRADARDLPGARALDLPRRRGPGLRPRHRLAQQLGQRHARRGGLGLPLGKLGLTVFRGKHPAELLRRHRSGVREPASPGTPTPRPNAPHGATSRRVDLGADESELCRRDARQRRREDEPARDRVIVQVRPRAGDFLQLAQTGCAEAG